MIKLTCDLVKASLSARVTTVPCLMVIGHVEVKLHRGFFCHVTSHDQMIKGTYDLVTESRLPFRFGGCRSYRSRDLMVLIPYVTQILFKKFAHRFHIKKQLLE